MPALRASRVDLNEVLKEGARGSSGGRRRGRTALLVAEVGAVDGAARRRRPDDARASCASSATCPASTPAAHDAPTSCSAAPGTSTRRPQDMNLVTPRGASASTTSCSSACARIPGVTRAGIVSRLPLEVWTHPFTIVGRPAAGAGQGAAGRPERGRRAGARHARHPAAARPA